MDQFLGKQVECKVSGLKGIATSRTHQFSGNIQYGVQPRSEDGRSFPDALIIDKQNLMLVDGAPSPGLDVTPEWDCSVAVGDEVVDALSGFTGTAVSKHVYLNGCIFFSVVPKHRPGSFVNAAPDGSWLDGKRLKVVKAARVEPPKQKPTGGPSIRIPRAIAR